MNDGKVTSILSKTIISFDSDKEIAEVLGNALGCHVTRLQEGGCLVTEKDGVTPSTAGRLFMMQTEGRRFKSISDALTIALDIHVALLEIAGEALSAKPKPAE